MGIGAALEPLVIVVVLFGGTWINRNPSSSLFQKSFRRSSSYVRTLSHDSLESVCSSPTSNIDLLSPRPEFRLSFSPDAQWHKRQLKLFGLSFSVTSPNTTIFHDRLLSRILRKVPFLVECWYWALVYWIYQLGRVFTAVTLKGDTVDVARRHALQLIKLEQQLGIFLEVPIQKYFLQHSDLMNCIDWIYSYIHIPGTVAFLVGLYYYTTTRNHINQSGNLRNMSGSTTGPLLYQARRRTLAVCNLLAFAIFTVWPCMPPRLLSDSTPEGPESDLGRSFGFVDTVHGVNGAGSVWTQNRFCNQYAAMPSLHFGYSLLIGLTIMTIPLPSRHIRVLHTRLPLGIVCHIPSWYRLICLVLGFLYQFIILVAIVTTANHFILDAVVGTLVCGLGWWSNKILLNLLPVEDYFLWLVRTQKPDPSVARMMHISGD
ncbi:integral membrane protein [Penicillium taxi]|uniref:uncharacterized protein n=1 Tax=Penicillium taxi TaxID=168475 RepID=UPI002545154D|nr:uncharacterized protein N7495_004590 [Penicillium taxi]KAJ5899846.1 integral membrane protein [Penicillium taxi]